MSTRLLSHFHVKMVETMSSSKLHSQVHISMKRLSQVPILHEYSLIYLSSDFQMSPPQPAKPKESLYAPSHLSLIHPSRIEFVFIG
ncbi:hypothetical protein QL285_023807 [Trifolium repens]|nr:hypothetical protein QL285_023807 [Trifolium repens]